LGYLKIKLKKTPILFWSISRKVKLITQLSMKMGLGKNKSKLLGTPFGLGLEVDDVDKFIFLEFNFFFDLLVFHPSFFGEIYTNC